MTIVETLEQCPLCGSKNNRKWCDGYDRLHKISNESFIYSHCKNCDLVFLSKRPSKEDIYKFYPDDYAPHQGYILTNSQSSIHNLQLNKFIKKGIYYVNRIFNKFFPDEAFNSQIQSFYNPLSTNSKLLDFGCGSEKFLDFAKEKGWKTLGMDFSPRVIDQVISYGHEALIVSDESWKKIEDNSIDFVRMNHVLEHLYNPRETLENIRAKLKNNGLLHIAVPNPSGLSPLVFRSRWHGLDCPRHIMLYPPSVLHKMLSDLGFAEFTLIHEVITKDFLRSWGYLLYDQGKITHKEVEEMMFKQDLSDLLQIPVKISSLLGRSDRYHVFAKKF
jgi:SAM-dependent methyltransferase